MNFKAKGFEEKGKTWRNTAESVLQLLKKVHQNKFYLKIMMILLILVRQAKPGQSSAKADDKF